MGQQASCFDGHAPGADAVESCACIPAGSPPEHADAPDKHGDSEHDRATSSRLIFPRNRVFKPHTRTRLQDYYQQERLIGQGSHGKVFKAVASAGAQGSTESWLNSRGVAVKCFELAGAHGAVRTQLDAMSRDATKSSFEREREMLAQLEHPHIIKMFECFEERDFLWIVMEVCHGGELYEYIASHVRGGQGVSLGQGQVFFRQMLHATSYLHAKQLVHRDLKTENFLLLGQPGSPDAEVVKLCDFGSATCLTRNQPRAMEVIGTLSYTAPEVYLEKGASFSADDWSLGACLYVLLVGASPFRVTGEEDQRTTIARICNGDYVRNRPQWAHLPFMIQDLVQRLLVVDERLRLTCAQALEHPWVFRGGGRRAKGRQQPESAITKKPPSASSVASAVADFAPYTAYLFQHLAHFASLDMMQRIVLNICAQLTPETEVIHSHMPLPWYNLFFTLDRDLDGRLGREELLEGLRQMPGHGYSEEEMEGFLYAVDVDGSGSVEWVEWVALSLLSTEGLPSDGEPLRTVFRLLDRPSGDGRVGAADLLALVEAQGFGTVATQDGRNEAVHLLGKWASRNTDKPANGRSRSEACLGWADLKLLLEEAAVENGGAELTEEGSDWRGMQAGGILCCTGEGTCAADGPFAGCKELAGPPLLPLLRENTFGSDVSDNMSGHSNL